MKEQLYHLLVNRVPGIRERFFKMKQKYSGRYRAVPLLYLLYLNVCYYLLGQRHLAQSIAFPFYEEKKLYEKGSESELSAGRTPEEFAETLSGYDVISLDVFDTLMLRYCEKPDDLFYFLGMRLDYPDMKRIRVKAEEKARVEKGQGPGTAEVTFEEIWKMAARETGIRPDTGMQAEWELEQRFCYANPYMQRVVQRLRDTGKRLVIISDMYLGKERIRQLLQSCGYASFDAYYVSCDYGCSKSDGRLYGIVKKKENLHRNGGWAHVGDHTFSDWKQAEQYGAQSYLYRNVHHAGSVYRPLDMSAVTGSIYRGIVNAQIRCGLHRYSREYEYGFLYGGLFAAGYCRFIHEYAKRHGIQKLLFLSRDGYILHQAYCRMYPQEADRAAYVYWSRLAALKVTADGFRYEYFRRFLYHKVNQGFSLERVMRSMELEELLASLCQAENLRPDEELTNRNVENVRKYLTDAWDCVIHCYEAQRTASGAYFSGILNGCRSAAAVDIGWAGSGAWMLDFAVNRIWKLDCRITGILAGTTTAQSPERDVPEPYYMSGKLVSYLYSQRENRDLWKLHDPAKKHNLYWEMLLSAPHGSLKGFYTDRDGKCAFRFKKSHTDAQYIREVHRGILDFVKLFLECEERIGTDIPVSGRDAYAPMVSVLSGKNKKFAKRLEVLMDEMHVT